ncbi:SRPBCC family protein [Methyloceanibacter caenitepidi]|uniref:Probable glutathione S-transferase-related transmembrane protein n=1 Tax=Methyloceanibacter caenitepidi TaxID=1384459 RepID=A0A0A8K751_9HYPH|nr:SRPBCC domain-containing protein [Methyloceanibacter caenitepidi]BAQ18631.1 probable glutathione S-transferase-related transmembrane protein [Methyloceanibacter caenitepidi]
MTAVTEDVLEIRRVIDASPDAVFDAWTTPELVEAWWGPHGYRTRVIELDAVVGGHFAFQMTAPSGASCPMSGTYTKVERPRRLAFEVAEHCIADVPDDVREPSGPSQVEIRFEANGETTEIVLRQKGLAADYRMLANGGWSQSLERADEVLRRA